MTWLFLSSHSIKHIRAFNTVRASKDILIYFSRFYYNTLLIDFSQDSLKRIKNVTPNNPDLTHNSDNL